MLVFASEGKTGEWLTGGMVQHSICLVPTLCDVRRIIENHLIAENERGARFA
jgi:hypothetical protein